MVIIILKQKNFVSKIKTYSAQPVEAKLELTTMSRDT